MITYKNKTEVVNIVKANDIYRCFLLRDNEHITTGYFVTEKNATKWAKNQFKIK